MARNCAVSLHSEFCFSCQHYGLAVSTTSEALTALEKSCLPLWRHKSSPSAPVTWGWWALRSSVRLSRKFLCWPPSALLIHGSVTQHQAVLPMWVGPWTSASLPQQWEGSLTLSRYTHAQALQDQKLRLSTFRGKERVIMDKTICGCIKTTLLFLTLNCVAPKAPVLLPCSCLAQSLKIQQFLRDTGIPMEQA